MGCPTLAQAAETMRHHWGTDTYPKLVYIETTNFCNANCTFCLYDRMVRPVQHMSMDEFERIAIKVKQRGLTIGAMFCFGEPLADKQLFERIRFGHKLGVMTNYLGLNTNVSLLTPDKYDDILSTCSNITLSFVNVGNEFERLTGLDWDLCYRNALAFIEYRDKHRPEFMVEIGCNDVTGHNRVAVQRAFAGQRVAWARDAEIHWDAKTITGIIDRSVMYHSWTCDGYKGALQVKPNGDCCFCAYDVVRSETRFANILTDPWASIEANFKELWKRPSSFCLRCDFWHNYLQMKQNGWKRGPHIDSSWQDAYSDAGKFWEQKHVESDIRFLTGTTLFGVNQYLDLEDLLRTRRAILDVGVGTGRYIMELVKQGHKVSGLDISAAAIKNIGRFLSAGFTTSAQLPSKAYSLAICNLVIQHMADVDVYTLIRDVLGSLRPKGILAIQYSSAPREEVYSETLERQRLGLVRRTKKHFSEIVRVAGGAIVKELPTKTFEPGQATDDSVWNGAYVKRCDS